MAPRYTVEVFFSAHSQMYPLSETTTITLCFSLLLLACVLATCCLQVPTGADEISYISIGADSFDGYDAEAGCFLDDEAENRGQCR